MEKMLEYAPILLVLLIFFLKHKFFVTPEKLSDNKLEIIKYISENYVSNQTHRDHLTSLENRINKIDQNVDEVKNLLISIVQKQYRGL